MIRAEGLRRTYGEFAAVNSASFEIGSQEIVGLLGHNGAGKTTIMKMITGYLEPSGGKITIDGADVWANRTAVQRQIGYLPENCPVYPEMNVLEYLDYAAALRGVPES
ncbi:MAG: ATP-binding cassette domain-containing protein, partial [Candidatus Obscuribacterales bacterium]|nr:ATP-binding cassette domain-containing protein [Candidatus Obscuribacterales bacterium]